MIRPRSKRKEARSKLEFASEPTHTGRLFVEGSSGGGGGRQGLGLCLEA